MGERAIQASSIPYIILRSTALYGYVPYHQGPNFVQTIINGVQKHGTLKIIGGNQLVDPLPIWDLARLIGKITIQAQRDNLVLNVAGTTQPLQNIADTISILLDEKSIPYTICHETLENPKGVLLDTHRVRQLFPDWEPTLPQVIIRDIIEHTFYEG
jgi:dTDP-4-dehydrorhamnose reductase